ncbi:MAG: hypothetical protein ICV71_02545 [Thermoleophilia bacterium]|nr:hypothetical protein [Thermoleophilia bacterium]
MEHANSSFSGWEREDVPLETLIHRAGLVSKERLDEALAEGERTGRSLGDVLVEKGWIDDNDLARLVVRQNGLVPALSDELPPPSSSEESGLRKPALAERPPDPPAPNALAPLATAPAGREAPTETDTPFRVVLRIEGGDDVVVSEFPTEGEAEEAARDFIARLARRDEWPLLRRTFVRPDRIFAVEISERQRWRGADSRLLWGAHDDV